jgi:hypothetical protein
VRNSIRDGAGTYTAAIELASLGSWFLWVGGIGLALGVVGRLALATPTLSFLAPFSGVITLATEACAVALAAGIVFLYFAANMWILVLAGVVAGLVWAVRYRSKLRKWLRLGSNPFQSTSTPGKDMTHG